MGVRSGVGLVELAILDALNERSGPRRRYVSCLKALLAMEDEIGLALGYGYQVLIDTAVSWGLPMPLIDGQGNFGSQGNDPAASPRYTEARLSPVGRVALAAERGDLGPVPIGLINGNTHRMGFRPPYRPAAVIEAIRQLMRRPRLTSAQINALVGPPDFFTGCTVTGDVAALAAGQRTELGLQARATVTTAAEVNARVAKNRVPGWDPPFRRDASFELVVLDRFAPYANPYELMSSIFDRCREHPWQARYPGLGEQAGLPIKQMRDESSERHGLMQVYIPADGTPAEELRDRLLKVRGVTHYVSVGLPKPLPTMLRTWTRTHQHEDLEASLTALEKALAAR